MALAYWSCLCDVLQWIKRLQEYRMLAKDKKEAACGYCNVLFFGEVMRALVI